MTQEEVTARILSESAFEVRFKPAVSQLFQYSEADKVALLATCEYEGIFKNGGVGTHYKTLSEQITANGWYVILLLCHTSERYGGQSTLPAIRHIFSTQEVADTLDLQPIHLAMLHSLGDRWIDYQSMGCLFFTQALNQVFASRPIFVEFHEMSGIGYHTIQAKRTGVLPSKCVIGVTMHSGYEWVYEANEWYAETSPDWFSHICDYEQFSYENADLAFFPSYYLNNKVASFGWKTEHAQHMPYFIPIVSQIPGSEEQMGLEINGNSTNKTPTPETQPLPVLTALLGMTTEAERRYVQHYAQAVYSGAGEIVDLGCWLGSFAVSLVIGLQENPKVNPDRVCVHAYDLFEWEPWMDQWVVGTRLEGRYKAGDSFLDAFLEQITPWKQQIKVYPGDLMQKQWDAALPIEYLLIDAMKSWGLANSIVRIFFPALIPGISWVHHQDFVHYYTSWIHLIMYRFREYFQPLDYAPETSFIFKYQKAIPPELLNINYTFEDFSDQEIQQAFDYSLSIVPPEARPNVAAAKAMLYVHLGDVDRAEQEIKRAKQIGLYVDDSDFPLVEHLIKNGVS